MKSRIYVMQANIIIILPGVHDRVHG